MSKKNKTINVNGTQITVFKPLEFERFKNKAGLNAFTLSQEKTNLLTSNTNNNEL